MRCLSFLVDGDYFAVDVTLVREFARNMTVTPVPSAPDAVIGITNMKGRVITLLNLCDLLGRSDRDSVADTVNAILFKSLTGDEDLIGLKIDKPGGLIDITEQGAHKPSIALEAEESFCISGIVEVDNELYRVLDIYSIIEKYKSNGEKGADSIVNGGIDDEEQN